MHRIASVTVARSDYGIYRPVYRALQACDDFELQVIVTGAHLSPRYGLTVQQIEQDGMPIAARLPMTDEGDADTPLAITRGTARGMADLAQVYDRLRPDMLLVLGDRFEMAAAVLAAQPFNLPVAHLHGGEVSQGAIDDALRHAITQMSRYHYVSHPDHARRVERMGHDPSHVVVTGAPALDNLRDITLPSRSQLSQALGKPLPEVYALVVFHPVTRQPGQAAGQMATLLSAMRATGLPCVIGYPNADAENHAIIQQVEVFAQADPRHVVYRNLDITTYFGLMAHAAVMVGNSSSGIIEAASLRCSVVNVGDRQKGRLHGDNVIDVPCACDAITQAIAQALLPAFRQRVQAMANPYGDGHAAERLVSHLRQVMEGQTAKPS